jgi:F-type H+-transporting ATPase subunit b
MDAVETVVFIAQVDPEPITIDLESNGESQNLLAGTQETPKEPLQNPIAFDWTLPMMVVSFLLVVWLLSKVAWKPLTNMMEKRRQNIESMLNKAESDREEAESLRLKHQEELRQAHQEVQALIEKATKSAEQRAAEMMEQARGEAEKIKQAALAQIEVERARAVADIQAQVADLSVAVAEKILRKNLDLANQEELINQFIHEVGDRPC